MGTGPVLRIAGASAERLYDDTWTVRVTVANDGFLPSYGSDTWLKTGQANPVSATLTFNGSGELVPAHDSAARTIGHLAGRVANFTSFMPMAQPADTSKGSAEWTVRASVGTRLTIEAGSNRAGIQRIEVSLE